MLEATDPGASGVDAELGQDGGRSTHARAASLALLSALAVGGNLLSVELLFGIRFFFGGVATLLALRLHGRVAGLLIGTLAATVALTEGAGTWFVPVVLLEVLAVGALMRRADSNMLVADAVFWVLVGLPVSAALEVLLVGEADTATAVVALKLAVNGIACALLASAAATHLPWLRRLASPGRRAAVSLQDTLFHIFVALVLLPALALLFVAGRLEIDERRAVLADHLHAASDETRTHLAYWIDHHRVAVARLAGAGAGLSDRPSPRLQELTRLYAEAFPDFHNVYVADARGRTVAFHPPVNELGESTIGLDFSDRPYYHELVRRLTPVTSEVFQGRGGVFDPIVTVSAPVMVAGRFSGFALGALHLDHLARLLAEPGRGRGVDLTVLDGGGRVVASSIGSRAPLAPLPATETGWQRTLERPGLYRVWPQPSGGHADLVRWQAARLVFEAPVAPGIPWTLVAEASLAPVQQQLLELYVRDLLGMLLATLLTLLLARRLSRWIVRPMRQLAQATRDLPARLTSLDAPPPEWPVATEAEVGALLDNFRSMTAALADTFRRLRERTTELARTNEELVAEAREREALDARVRQKQALEALGTLAGGIAHDFNNVLTTILGNVEIARRGAESDPDLAEALSEIERAGERARELVQQILTFSRRGSTDRQVVSLADAARDALRLLRSTLDPSTRLETRLPAGTAPVLANPTQLFQVITNLCTNAEHAARGGGGHVLVEVTTAEAPEGVGPPGGRCAVLSVTDDGPGMAPEVRERAFEPFFTTKLPGEGSGMGLAVVHGIVSEHGGAVEIDSRPGHGTTVRVLLPLAEGADTAEELVRTDPARAEAAGPRDCRVLLAEDDESVARLVRESLEEAGCEVVACRDGRRALDAFAADARGFDVVVTDLAMPGLGGAALIRALRSRAPRVGIVLCTGYRDDLPEQALEALDIDRIVLKPFRAADLAREVRAVAEARAAVR